jgi:hypothetical protein
MLSRRDGGWAPLNRRRRCSRAFRPRNDPQRLSRRRVVSLVDRDSASHPHFGRRWRPLGTTSSYQCSSWRAGCDSICRAWSLLRVPVFVLALLLIRGLPALLYVRDLGWPATVAVGLLPATSLLFLVTAATIGMQVGTISSVTGAALVVPASCLL